MKKLLFILLAVSITSLVAQENSGFNPNSVRPIHSSDIMYKKTVMRAIDLREKQNKSLFALNKEVTRIIMDAVKEGKLKAYSSDSLDLGKLLTKEEFMEKTKIPSETPELTPEEIEFQKSQAQDNVFGGNATPVNTVNFYSPTQLYQMELIEDFLFDKQRSRVYYDIQSITMKIPAEFNVKGYEQPIATFKYKDLVEVFKKDPRALWFNPENDQEHRNMADAFDLRLFSSYIIKVSNPDNFMIQDIYSESAKQGIMASYWAANQLMEYEHNLWEF